MANEYLKRTPTSTGNRSVYTWSGWVKINELNLDKYLFSSGDDASNIFYITLRQNSNNNNITILFRDGDTTSHALVFNNNSYRDPGSWMHLVVAVDATITTPTQDRVKVYINGKRLINPTTDQLGSLNANSQTATNALELHTIGDYSVTPGTYAKTQIFDYYLVDGQALTPDVFGFYKQGKGYISAGSTQATDFRPGQWVPKTPRVIKTEINRRGGFGVNGFYLPMNDSSNFGADFHTTPNSIITLKGEDLPQPRNGAPTTTDAYVSQLRADPYAANLVFAVPGIGTAIGADIVTNGYEWTGASGTTPPTGWYTTGSTATYSVNSSGQLVYNRNGDGTGDTAKFSQDLTTVNGKVYHLVLDLVARTGGGLVLDVGGTVNVFSTTTDTGIKRYTFTATSTTTTISMRNSSTSGTLTIDNVKVRQVDDAPLDYSADIKGSGTNKTLTANGNAGVGYEIPSYYGSALSFDGTDDYFSGPTNDSDFHLGSDDFTVEAWVYPTSYGANEGIVGVWGAAANRRSWLLYNNPALQPSIIIDSDGAAGGGIEALSGIAITTGQWTHIAGERNGSTLSIYVNGVATGIVTNASGSVYTNTSDPLDIGSFNGSNVFEGYIQDLRIYKGVAKYKGGFDVPKPYTPIGIATWRAVPDCTANNFATLNSLYRGEYNARTLTNGNLTISHSSDDEMVATVGITTGKWYWETLPSAISSNNNYYGIVGAGATSLRTLSYYYRSGSGTIVRRIDNVTTNLQSSLTNASANDVIGIAFNASDKELSWYLNGTQLGTTVTSIASTSIGTPEYFPFVANQNTAVTKVNNLNFGQNPTFSGNTTAGTFTDSNGKGLFKYQPPSGFLALCEDNLPTPTISDPGKHFKTVLYTGDSNNGRSITGLGFKPDLVWLKGRTTAYNNLLVDSVRGAGNILFSDSTSGERGLGISLVNSFNSDGFGVNYFYETSSNASANGSSTNYVAWCWRAGAGTTSTNTDGSIPSVVSVNQDAGFSIVSYTSNGTSGATVGHNLNKTPSFIIVKMRSSQAVGSADWAVYHKSLGATKNVWLNATNGQNTSSAYWNNTEPTSSVFSLGNDLDTNHTNGYNYIAYCWAEIEGFSKFGIYVGNGNADGPMVYTGGKPAFLMIKRTDTTNDWVIKDSSRNSINPTNLDLYANTSQIEVLFNQIDFLSNGFKIRNTNASTNASGGTYIFACWMESPFTTANAK